MGAECAYLAHLKHDCGNKTIGKLKHNNSWPFVHLDIFLGLGLRATKCIKANRIIGPYYGRAKTMPK
eukprot:786514-Rhodomonas_salina.1